MAIMETKTVYILSFLLGLVLLTAAMVSAQQPTPMPRSSPIPSPTSYPTKGTVDRQPATPATESPAGNYNIVSSIELGVRGLSVDGNNKYRSDLNYRPGFRLFDSSFLMRRKEGTGTGTLFDTFLINSTGFNADPYGSLRVNMEKSEWYRFDASFRRNTYQNNLLNLALNQHIRDTRHKFGDFDLRLLPNNRRIHFNLGYSLDRNSGTGLTTYDAATALISRADEFPILTNIRTRADEYRFGVEGRVSGIDLSFLQGIRSYSDDSTYFITGVNQGNNLTNTAFLSAFQRDMPTRGRAYFTRVNAHTFLAKRLDITARYTYTTARSRFTLAETQVGRNAVSPPQTIQSDTTNYAGETTRPTHLGEIGLTWLATNKLRISDTFRYNTFRNHGAQVYQEIAFLLRANGTPATAPFPATIALPISNTLNYRRLYNQLEADYQFGPRFSFHFGHRYTNRHIDELDLGTLLPSPIAAPFVEREETFRLHSNSFFGGFKARPVKAWTVYFDAARGEANDVFTRSDNRKSVNFRVRNRITPRPGLGINVSFITRDNDNPGETVIDRTLVGPLSARQFDVQVRDRNFSSSVDWTPLSRYSFSTGYTHLHATSDAAILFFPLPTGCVGTTVNPTPACAQGRSQYYLRDNFFYFNASVFVNRRLSTYASYRISKDTGQGGRVSDIANRLFVGSVPLSFQSPEVRLIFKVNRHVDWNVGYQYYDYKEKFSTAQNYRAHLPYTSLRIYFGAGESR
jgi:hypothetical protein